MTVNEKNSGITTAHAQIIEKIAGDRKCFIFIRAVNTLATSLLISQIKTKGLDIHGKSADWGPQAAYIPFKAELSKAAGDDKAVSDGNKANKDSSAKKHIGTVQLKVTIERLHLLKRLGCLQGMVQNTEVFTMEAAKSKKMETYEFQFKKEKPKSSSETPDYLVAYRSKRKDFTTLQTLCFSLILLNNMWIAGIFLSPKRDGFFVKSVSKVS